MLNKFANFPLGTEIKFRAAMMSEFVKNMVDPDFKVWSVTIQIPNPCGVKGRSDAVISGGCVCEDEKLEITFQVAVEELLHFMETDQPIASKE